MNYTISGSKHLEPVEVSRLIDLTDKPIGLGRDEIGWAKVKANASNCICCCNNNSITLVTTDNSYVLDHVPLDNIQFAQTNPNLQHLALSNHSKLVVIDLINSNCHNTSNRTHQRSSKETMVVNLASSGLTMADVMFWRWLDNHQLAILTYEALYTCSIDQTNIKHPAYTAIERQRHLSLEKIFDTHPHLSALCQVTDVQRDSTGNLYAISGLYSTSGLCQSSMSRPNSSTNILQHQQQHQPQGATSASPDGGAPPGSAKNGHQKRNPLLKPSFGSMPSRLSQLAHLDQHSFDSMRHEYMLDRSQQPPSGPLKLLIPPPTEAQQTRTDMICGLAQIYCRKRNRSQLIQAHAVTYTSSFKPPPPPTLATSVDVGEEFSFIRHHQAKPASQDGSILVAANRINGDRMRVHFIEMATGDQWPSSGQNASPTTAFNHLSSSGDFPTAIVCSYIKSQQDNDHQQLHVALITTKRGQLFVCSVTHSTILFTTSISSDTISSTVLESNTGGLMVICRNGHVLLVRLDLVRLMKLLEESKTLRHISSHSFLSSLDLLNNNNNNNNNGNDDEIKKKVQRKSESSLRMTTNGNGVVDDGNRPKQLSTSLNHLEVTMSTRL